MITCYWLGLLVIGYRLLVSVTGYSLLVRVRVRIMVRAHDYCYVLD